MQKVAKEHLGLFKPHKDAPPALLDVEKVEHLEYLLKARENLLYTELRKKMASAMVYTKVGKKMPGILKPIGDKLQEKGIFNTWMLQEQDLIQAFAKSYADRIVCEAFRETIAGEFGPVDPSLSGVLGSVFHLHLLNSVEKDLSTFLASDLLNSSQAEQVVETSRRLCAELTPSSLALIESFGLPEEMLQSPIASDWVGYNAYDNQGELQTDGEFQEVLHKTKPDLSMGYSN
jgi:acyl-CoA oxidase